MALSLLWYPTVCHKHRAASKTRFLPTTRLYVRTEGLLTPTVPEVSKITFSFWSGFPDIVEYLQSVEVDRDSVNFVNPRTVELLQYQLPQSNPCHLSNSFMCLTLRAPPRLYSPSGPKRIIQLWVRQPVVKQILC